MVKHNRTIDPADDFASFDDGSHVYSRKGPERRSARRDDPLQDTLETLYSEHRYIISLLDTLEREAERVKPGKIPDYHLLLEIVDYLIHYPDQYHHPREDLLFSGMLEHDARFKPQLDRLLREHQTLHHFTHELYNELTRVTEGRPVRQRELKGSLERYIAGYRQHIEYENQQVFPNARGSLSRADLKKLERKTRFIDDPLFGGEVQYRYHRLGRNLQARVEVASGELMAREMSGIETGIERVSALVDTAGRLRESMGQWGRDSWQEQVDTMKSHARPGEGPGIARLPLALVKNHLRHLDQGLSELRGALADGKRGR